ncbi:hypothetical protein ABIA39_009091 [Nocardia sp. GAS34]|uniref:DUF3761 domain-containing protein n=1 Tax=unclassified Nocardia TaxID=2637762 RepID=UPI003D262C1F
MSIDSRRSHRRTLRGIVFVPWVFAIAAGLGTPAATPVAVAGPVPIACAANEYENIDGVCVLRPESVPGDAVPAGATARCRDGDYSFTRHRRGACSGHEGVAQWLVSVP